MPKPILIVYGSWAGSTREVAEFIAKEMKAQSIPVEIKPAGEVRELESYGGLILGSGIRAGRIHPAVMKFTTRWKKELTEKPLALFVVCLTMQQDTEKNRCTAAEYMKTLESRVPGLNPVSVGLFGGMLDMARLRGPVRLLMKMMKGQPGDYRDWDAIGKWIRDTVPSIVLD